MKTKCTECKKIKHHYAKGKCENCYRRLLYRNLPKEEKKRRGEVSKKYVILNREKRNAYMKKYMRSYKK